MNIKDDVTVLKGVGPKIRSLLNNCGIFNILDLILYFPKDYEEANFIDNLEDLNIESRIAVKGRVIKIKKDVYVRKNLIISTMDFLVKDSKFQVKWFNQPYIKSKFNLNEEYTLLGTCKIEGSKKTLINPVLITDTDHKEIIPKYRLKNGLTNSLFIKLISEALNNININENLSNNIVHKYNLCTLNYAMKNIHNPQSVTALKSAKERLKFQELLIYSLKLQLLKEYKHQEGISFKVSPELKELKMQLPYDLTEAQNRVIREILIDEKRNTPMNRLVQGDVGSGKTIVALIALFNIAKNGYQSAFLAPTEILATQHYEEAVNLFKNFRINIELLTGSTTNKNKNRIKEDLKSGKVNIIIGTHALLEENVEFFRLGMVITDEQHRFGVTQRNKLLCKNEKVDVLVMSATPIPRTLALTLYGDLSISTIDQLPPGRKKVDTFCVEEKMRKRIYNFALKEIENGAQVYVVCPLVEENEELDILSVEELYSELKVNYFQNINIGILNGKMKSRLKDEVMEKFKNGEIKVLISTTVIEVGVNVPNATLMIIENAERFGLSQLHQLRGRVGRGNKKSYCILVSKFQNEVTKKRMNIITRSNDGFFIAEEDLKLRGSGEVFGTNQHGDDELIFTNIVDDFNLFKTASSEAKLISKSVNEEDILLKEKVQEKLHQTLKYICFN